MIFFNCILYNFYFQHYPIIIHAPFRKSIFSLFNIMNEWVNFLCQAFPRFRQIYLTAYILFVHLSLLTLTFRLNFIVETLVFIIFWIYTQHNCVIHFSNIQLCIFSKSINYNRNLLHVPLYFFYKQYDCIQDLYFYIQFL